MCALLSSNAAIQEGAKMFRKELVILFCLITMAGITTHVDAFDGQRKGFILGGGLGLGSTDFEQSIDVGPFSSVSGGESTFSFQTNFKIGYAPSEQMEIYYFSHQAFFGMENILRNNVTIASGVGGAGVTYFFKTQVPSFFIAGGIGMAMWALPFESNADTWTGFGLTASGGYEFSRHVSFEVGITYGEPSLRVLGVDFTTKATTIRATINALAY
jgi:hypothetical protein